MTDKKVNPAAILALLSVPVGFALLFVGYTKPGWAVMLAGGLVVGILALRAVFKPSGDSQP